MKREVSKACQKQDVINTNMDVTFASRRQLINTNCKIQQLNEMYPCLFTTPQIKAEFQHLMNVDLEQTFTDNMLDLSPSLVKFASKKKKTM